MPCIKKASVIIGKQIDTTLPPALDIDSIFSEFTHFEWSIFIISLISASIFSKLEYRIHIGISIWCGIGLILISLYIRQSKRKASMKCSNSLLDNHHDGSRESNEGPEEFEDCFEDGSFLDTSTLSNYPKNRNISIPINCIRIIEAKAHSSYAEYRIVITIGDPDGDTAPIQWEVWRRYSEFSGLRARLRSCHLLTSKGAPSGWSPPFLPAKSLRRHLDDKYLKERRAQLEKFILVLLYHPLIRKSEEMRAFLCFSTTQKASTKNISSPRSLQSLQTLSESGTMDSSKHCSAISTSQHTIKEEPPQLTPEELDKQMEELCWEGNQPNIDGNWRDCRRNHDFMLRGQLYMDDKVKSHAGDAVMKFLCCRVYRCRKEIDGDRIDHIATKGTFGQLMAKLQKMSAPFREPNEPQFFIVNIQIPGNPVVHVVQLFALPTAYAKRYPGSSDAKFRAMFKRYYEDLPVWEGGEAESSLTASPELGVSPLTHFRNQRFKLVVMFFFSSLEYKLFLVLAPHLFMCKISRKW